MKEHATEGVATPDATAESKSKVSKKGTPTPAQEKGGKKTPAGARDLAADDPASQEFPEADPENPNKHRCTPDCAALEMSQMLTMSQVKDHFVHASNLDEEI